MDESHYFTESIRKLTKIIENLADTSYKVFLNFFFKNKKIWLEKENCLFYPDLFIVDSQEVRYYKDRKEIISNPLMIVEVSTIDSMAIKKDQTFLTDRKDKLWMYQKIPSVKEYVLLADNGVETVVETYNRLEENSWKYQSFSKLTNQIVTFETIDLKIPIIDLYL